MILLLSRSNGSRVVNPIIHLEINFQDYQFRFSIVKTLSTIHMQIKSDNQNIN